MGEDKEVEPIQVLFDKGTLLDLYIGRWAGIRRLQPDDMLIENLNQEALYLGHKKLLPKQAMEKLVQLEGKARTTLAKKSLDFPVGGARFVYYKALPEVLLLMKGLKAKWDVAVDELIANYPELRDQQLKVLDEQAERLALEDLKKVPIALQEPHRAKLEAWKLRQRGENESLYPTAQELRMRFPFQWRMFKVSALQGIEELSTLEADELIAAKETLKKDLQEWVKTAATEMHKALGIAAAHANSLLSKQGKLNPKNLKPLFEAFETFKAIDFTGNSEFQGYVDELKAKFGASVNEENDYEKIADMLNDSDFAKENLKSLLAKVGELAVEDVAQKAGAQAISKVGEFSRFVDLS